MHSALQMKMMPMFLLSQCRFDRGSVQSEEFDEKAAIFVSKLSPTIVDDSELSALFQHIGPIVYSKVQRGAKGRSKGWGVIKFESSLDAKKAVETMNGVKVVGSNAPLEIKFDRK